MIRTLLVGIFTIITLNLVAQNFPGSPYSHFGIGDIYYKGFGQHAMVASTGIADRDGFSLNNINPASYSALRRPVSFVMETGLSTTLSWRESEETAGIQADVALPYLAFGFTTGKKSSASIGMRQYSNVSYSSFGEGKFSGIQDEYNVIYTGEGGLSEVYLGWARNFTKRLSFGFHTSFLFGQITDNQRILSGSQNYNLTLENRTSLTGLAVDFGLQYVVTTGPSLLTLGLTASPSGNLEENRSLDVFNQSMSAIGTLSDTVSFESLDSEINYARPATFGAGLTWMLPSKTKISADFQSQIWTPLGLNGNDYSLENSYKLGLGVQRLPDYKEASYLKRMSWGLGYYHELSYLVLDGQNIRANGITLGFNLPVNRNQGILRFVTEFGTRGEILGDSFRDSFVRFTFSATILENWFSRRKYQ